MSRKKLLGLLMVPLAVVAVGGGAVMLTSNQANAQGSQTQQKSADKAEPGDTPDKPGEKDQPDSQDQKDQNGQKEQNEQTSKADKKTPKRTTNNTVLYKIQLGLRDQAVLFCSHVRITLDTLQ